MKVRIADELPIVPLGGGNLMGKVLVSLADNVGFSMYEFYAKPGDEVTLAAFHPNHNHIYYCTEGIPHPLFTGRCTIHSDATEQLLFTADHLLALTSESTVYASVQEPMRIVAASVPRDPSVSPPPLLMKSLSEVVDSDRNVFFKGGYSRRFLAAPDGYNISFHNTLVHANFNAHLHYPRNMEANFFIKGQGEYIWKNGHQQFDSEKHHGTMLLVEHDPHEVKIGASDSIGICLFFPPLKGTERLRLDQESGSSY